MTTQNSARRLRWAVGLALVTSACTHAAKEIAGEAAGAAATVTASSALDQALVTLNEPQNEARLRTLISSPEYEEVGRRLLRGMVRGVFEGLSPEQVPGQPVPANAAAFGDAMYGYEARASGLVSRVAGSMVDSVLARLSTERSQKRIAEFSGALADTVSTQVAGGLERELGPALGRVLAEQLGPALGEVLRGPTGTAIAETANNVGREATRGAAEGLFGASPEEGRAALGAHTSDAIESGLRLGLVALILGSLAATGFVLWMVVVLLELRRMRQQNARQEAALFALLQSMASGAPKGNNGADRIEPPPQRRSPEAKPH